MKKCLLIFLSVLAFAVFIGCKALVVPTYYSVSYNGNGLTGGTVPTDSNSYEEGATVTVAEVGTMVLSGSTFDCWNTAANGNGTSYEPGAAFFIGTSDIILYAQWTGPSNYTISGKVMDSVTGAGVSGAKVGFGSNILTTDASGNYSVTAAANEAITGNFYVSKGTEYNFSVFSGLNLTPVSDSTYNIQIYPADTSAYTTHTLSGFVYQSDGTTEIADYSHVNITIINENGGIDVYSATYDVGTGYSIETETFGSSCILVIKVNDTTPFNYYIDNVDLSASIVPLNLTRPSTGYSTATITGEENDFFMGTMFYSDSISFEQVIGSIDATTTEIVQIYNPDSKNFVWTNMILGVTLFR